MCVCAQSYFGSNYHDGFFKRSMESGENTTTIPQTEHKVPTINVRGNAVAKAALLQTGGFKVLLKPLTERTEQRKMSFVKKTQACTKKPQAKHNKKLKKQFILAQNCEHWISMSKITACNYISLIACIKVLGRNRRTCYFRLLHVTSCLFTGRKMTFLQEQGARENLKNC